MAARGQRSAGPASVAARLSGHRPAHREIASSCIAALCRMALLCVNNIGVVSWPRKASWRLKANAGAVVALLRCMEA